MPPSSWPTPAGRSFRNGDAADLAADGYTTAPVANSTGPQPEQSIIYYLEGDDTSLAVARLLAKQIPTAQTLPMPEPPPLDRPLNGATVALLLGRDAAGRPLADLQTGGAASERPTPAPG